MVTLSLLLRRRPTLLSSLPFLRHLSSSPTPVDNTNTNTNARSNSKPPSLSSRLSFVFDQLDSLDRPPDISSHQKSLQQIRTWRQNEKDRSLQTGPNSSDRKAESKVYDERSGTNLCNERSGSDLFDEMTGSNLYDERSGSNLSDERNGGSSLNVSEVRKREVELVHPWPEWIELMEHLAKQNYFEVRRTDEQEVRVAAEMTMDLTGVEQEGSEVDITRDWRTVKNACWNFSRDRFDIIRKLQRKDIEVLVGHGCPSMEQKVVFSAKILRKLVHLNEGDVCSSCSLRNNCSRGYILTPKEDEARTLDVLRILLAFGFHPINNCVENKDLLKLKPVKNVARKLMHDVVRLSEVPIEPGLTPPVVRKPEVKVKQPPPMKKKRVGRDDVEMKKGDWLCPKCDFMNFAKNTDCLQCDAKRPKRQLLPGEWECPRCKFLNYRRNMACFECEHQRPPDEYTSNQAAFRETGRPVRAQPTRIPEVSDAWNFDFDENESDGADVAAFEFADSSRRDLDNNEYNNIMRERRPGLSETKPDAFQRETGRTGFDDFEDEDDDDLDSFEIVKGGNGNSGVVRKNYSELENYSDPDEYNEFARGGKRNLNRDYFSNEEEEEVIEKRSYGRRNDRNKRGGKRMESEDDVFESDSDENFNGFNKSNRKGRVSFDELDSDEDEEFPSTKNKGRKLGSRSRLRSYDDVVSDEEEESWDRRRGKVGNNGGFRGRKDHSFGNNGGFRGRKDDSFGNNGGFRGRRDDSFGGNGGFSSRKDDSFGNNGGSRGQRDDSFSNKGGFRGRRDESFGNKGGFRGRKDESFGNNGGFRSRRDDSFDNKGGYRGRKDESFGNSDGFRGPKRNERGRNRDEGFERGRSNGDRAGFGSRNRGGNSKSFGRDKFDDRPQRRAKTR